MCGLQLIQSWKIAIRRKYHLAKLLLLTGIALLLGTLPFIDNWGHIGAFLFGLPLSIIFVPYITFGFVACVCGLVVALTPLLQAIRQAPQAHLAGDRVPGAVHDVPDGVRHVLPDTNQQLLQLVWILHAILRGGDGERRCKYVDCVPYVPSISCDINSNAISA